MEDHLLRDYTRTVSTLPKGIAFARYAMALACAKGDLTAATEFARVRTDPKPADLETNVSVAGSWRGTPQTYACLKAASAAGTTTTSGWASELAVYQNMADEFVSYLRPMTIMGRLTNAVPVPFLTNVPRVSAGSSASWVGQNKPIPVSALAFDLLSLPVTKIGSIVVLTTELSRESSPSAEAIVKADMGASIVQYSDAQFIDPTVAASAGVSPASITYGATATASTGNSVAQITADVQAMFASAIAGGVSLQNAAWVLHPRSAGYLSSVLTTGGARMWPEVSIRGGSWFGIPVLVSAGVPVDSGDVTYAVLIDGAEIMFADGGIELDASSNASLQMVSDPTDPATSTISLFQSNMVGIRAIRYLNYSRRRDAAVQVLTGVAW